MTIFNVPLGMNVKDNPLVKSPYDQGQSNNIYPHIQKGIETEGQVFLLTESAEYILQE